MKYLLCDKLEAIDHFFFLAILYDTYGGCLHGIVVRSSEAKPAERIIGALNIRGLCNRKGPSSAPAEIPSPISHGLLSDFFYSTFRELAIS